MLESMLDPFILLAGVRDDDGHLIDLRYVEVNDAAVTYNNLSREQMVGARLLDLFPGQLDHGPLRQYFRTIETGEPTVLDDYAYGHEVLGEERRYDIRATRCGDGIALTWRDVTDRHRVAQALSLSERQYRLLADNSSDVIMLGTLEDGLTWVSPSVATVFGRKPDEVLGFAMSSLVHPDDVPTLRRQATDAMETGEDRRYRYRVRCGDGTYRWVEALSHWLPRDGTSTQQRLIRLRDIDDQVHAELDLAASEEWFRLLAENSSDMVFLRDEDLTITWVSPSCESVLGVSVDEILGRSVNEFVPAEDVVAMGDQISQMHRTGSAMQYRIRVRSADGTYRWFSGNSRPLPGGIADGRRWVVSLSDIDEQVRAERDLAERERLYRLLAENSTDAIMLATGQDAECVWVSPAAQGLLGWTPEELVGRVPADLIHPDDLADAEGTFAAAVESGDDLRQQYRVRCADGSFRWVEAAARLIPGTQPLELVVRLRDIDDQVRAQLLLGESERLYRLLAENVTDVILLAAADGRFLWVSSSAEPTLGWRPEELTGHLAVEFVHPDDRAQLANDIEVSDRSRRPVHQRYRWRRPDETYHWVEAIGRPVSDVGNGRAGRVVTLREVDAEVVAQQDLQDREERYRLLAENASEVVWEVRDDGTLTWISPSAEGVFGRSPQALLGTPSESLIFPDDRARFAHSVEQVRSGGSATGEFRVCATDGEPRWMEVTLHSAASGAGSARVATLRDVDDTVRVRKGLEFALQHDQATGLPTRAAMADHIERTLPALGPGERLSVLIVGIDLLSDVNDAYGHEVGDIVISTAATRLANSLGRPDLLGRGAGDEFIAVVPISGGAAEAVALAEQLRSAVRGELETGGRTLTLSASIGIAVSESGSTAADLIQEATTALHRAKELGRNRWSFADPERGIESARRLALEAEIRAGLETGEFVPWFQPIVLLADDSLAGYEALARWQNNGQIREPAEFLDVLVHSQWVSDLDHAIVEPSVATLAQQSDRLFVSINVTGVTLTNTDYAAHVRECLDTYGVDPRRLHIEVTETMLLNLDEPVLDQMGDLASLGVRWYVDDFGTGYSAISHLRDMPVSGLKLDRSFTEGIRSGDATARQLANGLVGLANGLALDTVAEGIETRAEADYLRTLGWRHGQGWLFGKAAPLS